MASASVAGWGGGGRERAGERRPHTSGPFSPVRPPSRGRGRWARGAGLLAAAREAGRAEGGGAAPGGRSCPRARCSAAQPLEQPGHETLTAAAARAVRERRDGRTAAAKEDASAAAGSQVREARGVGGARR